MPACKKHEPVKDAIDKPQLPPEPQEAIPVSGETQPESPNSSLVYRKVNMVVGYNKQISLDIDADGISDFNFFGQLIYHDEKPHLYLLVSPKTAKGASVMVKEGEELVINALWTFPLEKETIIQANPTQGCIWTEPLMKGFIAGSSKTSTSEEYTGLWIGKQQRYMGIKFKLNGKFHYGWVKLSHNKLDDEVTLDAYAYNKLPEQGIIAGKTE